MAGRVGGPHLTFVHARLVEHVPALELAAHLARLKVGQAHRARAVRRLRRWVEDHAAHLGNLLRAQASIRRIAEASALRHVAVPLDDAPAAAAEDAHQAEAHHGAADVPADENAEHEREREAQPV
jgi:hypothetical protein